MSTVLDDELMIDDLHWSVEYRTQPSRSRLELCAIRNRTESSRQRLAREARHRGGSRRRKASLSNGVHRRCNKGGVV